MSALGALDGPYVSGVAVTPSDSTVLPATHAIMITGAGNINIQWMGGAQGTTVFPVTAGQILRVRAIKVMATSTTATGIVALY